jgi:hypothetical protein
VSGFDRDELMSALFKVHPVDVLDELFCGDHASQRNSVRVMNDHLQFRKNPMTDVADDVITKWCDVDPASRYPSGGRRRGRL